jgi:hypothetical protein
MSEEVKDERKIYKGTVVKVADLATKDFRPGVPVQPIFRSIPGLGKMYDLPPTFVVTRFTPGYAGKVNMHYYVPAKGKAGAKAYRELPQDFELNLLTGRRGQELTDDWDRAKKTYMHSLVRRSSASVGADPEVFVVSAKEPDQILPAWTFLGSKDNPTSYASADNFYKGTCYWDGFQAEFTTQPSIFCVQQFTEAVRYGLQKVWKSADKKYGDKAKLSLKSVLPVLPETLESEKTEHVAFGCSPSYNAYGLKGNARDGRDVPWRFAGGHIHLGLSEYVKNGSGQKLEQGDYEGIVRSLDRMLGLACVSMFGAYDDPRRREYYGLPGEYRLPPHGLEYRVLSNAWLAHPLILNMVYDLTRCVVGLELEGFGDLWPVKTEEAVEIIQKHDVARARELLTKHKAEFTSILGLAGGSYMGDGLELAWKVWSEGMESAVAKPENLVSNWSLDEGIDHWIARADRYFFHVIRTLQSGRKV